MTASLLVLPAQAAPPANRFCDLGGDFRPGSSRELVRKRPDTVCPGAFAVLGGIAKKGVLCYNFLSVEIQYKRRLPLCRSPF